MLRGMRLAGVLRTLAKLAAVVVLGGAAGAGLGVGVAALTEDAATVELAPAPLTASGTPAATPPAATTARSRTDTASNSASDVQPRPSRTVRVRVLAAVLHPGATSLGRRRQRARLGVHVRVTNGGTAVLKPARPMLLAPGVVVPGKAVGGPGRSLREPLEPLASAQDRLRFETAGAVTKRIVTTRRVRLRVAGSTVFVRVNIGPPVARPVRSSEQRSPASRTRRSNRKPSASASRSLSRAQRFAQRPSARTKRS